MTPSELTRLDAQLHRLQLHHIQSHYQAFATKAAEQHRSHLDYLAQLVEGEARSGIPPTPLLSPARPHRDGHHADRITRRFRPRDALQTARDVTEPFKER
jgi:hypothetical protein